MEILEQRYAAVIEIFYFYANKIVASALRSGRRNQETNA